VELARRVPILANPRAGTGKALRIIDELVFHLAGHGFQPKLCWEREELTGLVRSAGQDSVRCIVSAGGDGTLLEVLNRAPGVPVTILPLGNENLVARYCRIERSGRAVANLVLRGRLRTVDLARCNGRLFSIMAGIGFDADVVHRVHHQRTGHINKLSWLMPIASSLTNYRYPEMQIEIEDTGEKLSGAMSFLFNIPRYAMDFPLARDAIPDDGLLNLCVFSRPGRLNLARYVLAVLRGKHASLPDCQLRLVKRVRIDAGNVIPVQTDGDPADQLPIVVEAVPGAATLVVP
jgi:diacylglycerol kinase family enzyme